MPLLTSSYTPRNLFKNGHFSTIYSSKLRQAPKVKQARERIYLADGDFMDLDWSTPPQESRKIVVLLHGLEGNAQRTYMQGAAHHLNQMGWHTLSVNFRGCSGEANNLYKSYTAGATDDLEAVIQHVLKMDYYKEIALKGFSLGGNLMLKYLGERTSLPKVIKKAVAISSPLSLQHSLEELNKKHNFLYSQFFLLSLKKKLKAKSLQFPDQIPIGTHKKIKTLLDFDNIYTSKAHGFKDAYEYYQKNSSLNFIPKIKLPVLIINALNDSFLSPLCYPFKLAEKQNSLFLETPKYGGHVGFYQKNNMYYTEKRAAQFFNEL